jgi:hypothetical protein
MEDQNDDVRKPSPLSEELVIAFTQHFYPADDLADSDETKSTLEMIDEMESIGEILPWEVNFLMKEFNFKLHYTGSGYVWLLKKM